MIKKLILTFIMTVFCIVGCTTPSTLTPIADKPNKHYEGTAQIFIAVEGTDDRKVRHIEIGTQEEEGYEIYFHKEKTKVGEGFIVLEIPTPSHNVFIQEYSLTGMYGCSRGRAGYGESVYKVPLVEKNKIYFLGTISTSMNTTYQEIPEELLEEAQTKYHYKQPQQKKNTSSFFRSKIDLN